MEMFSLTKFFSGFNLLDPSKTAKIIFILILVAIGIGIYHKTFMQPTTKIGRIDKQIIYTEPDRIPVFGCALWRVQGDVYWKKARKVDK